MSKTYLLIDTLNLFFRTRHVVRGDSPEEKVALNIHINFMSLRKAWKKFNADHMVFFLEGKSWRKTVCERYKANRIEQEMTQEEERENKLFWEAYEEFIDLMQNKTNVSVLRHELAEADDLIARWIATHPTDKHVIVSSDSDFVQLVSDNVTLFNGVRDVCITPKGVFDDRNRRIEFSIKNDGKIKIGKQILKETDSYPNEDWIEYCLFSKVVRGDAGDNILPACQPGTRQKGSSKKTGIMECFEDRNIQGYDWFNFMNQRWIDHNGKEHIVRDLYEYNQMLIDLTKMPEEVQEVFDEYILNYSKDPVQQLGFHFLRFVNQFGLEEIKKFPNDFVEMLNARNDAS